MIKLDPASTDSEPHESECRVAKRRTTSGVLARAEIDSLYQKECRRKSDIQEHLPTLRSLAEECRHVTEFGVGGVVSTLAFLAARPNRLHCYDLRSHPKIELVAALAHASEMEFRFFLADVREVEIAPTDLLFIDTFHRYEQLRCELHRHSKSVCRYIVLHDTMTFGWKGENGGNGSGLLSAVHEFLYRNRDWRIKIAHPNNNGLMVLERFNGIADPPPGTDEHPPAGPSIIRNGEILGSDILLASGPKQFESVPTVGLVVGTFAALPYVHLQLEARRRLYSHIPMLVHDDASARSEELRNLCREYGADFESNAEHCNHALGDLTVFLGGMQWAATRGLDILVKFSRRFLPLEDWTADLQQLATESQGSTFTTWTRKFGFGFRTECMGLAVAAWRRAGIHREIARVLEKKHCALVEAFMHEMTRRVALADCEHAKTYSARVGARPRELDAYIVWPFLGFCRGVRYPQLLWHDSASPKDYYALSQQWDLPYRMEDFLDPNR